jgi:hypothetical protein
VTPATRSAKKFLIGQIMIEAANENVPLSELEHRMLEFSEAEKTPRNFAELNAEFENEYDTAEYEEKIASLIRNRVAGLHAIDSPELDQWNDAVITLSEEDHYLLVMIGQAQPRLTGKLLTKIGVAPPERKRPPFDRLKLFLTAIVVVVLGFALMALLQRLGLDLGQRR